MLVPPGVICDLTQIEDTSMPVAAEAAPGAQTAHVGQGWDVSLDAGLGVAGARKNHSDLCVWQKRLMYISLPTCSMTTSGCAC